jgi:hypothetical protein
MQRVALVSCVKSKRDHVSPAGDLYTSPLFRGLRAYAKAHADRWYILSAKHGLLHPEDRIGPYEKTLNNAGVHERREWAERVEDRLEQVLPAGCEVLILAGQRYREYLVPYLESRGHRVLIPLEGLQMGQQLKWLKESEQRRPSGPTVGGTD